MPRKAPRDYTMEEQLARGPLDLPFLMLTMMLLGIGLVMMFSASYAVAYYDPQVSSPYFYIKRQATFAVGGVMIMMIVSHDQLSELPLDVGARHRGVISSCWCWCIPPWAWRRTTPGWWLKIGIRFQPSEIAKVAVILFFRRQAVQAGHQKTAALEKPHSGGAHPEFSGAHRVYRAGPLRGHPDDASPCWW